MKFYFEDEEVNIVDINSMNYYEFLKHEIVLYIQRDQCKREQSYFKKKIEQKSFYPLHIIFVTSNDTKESKQIKLKQSQKKNEEKFKMRYCQIAKKQFGVASLFAIRNKIKKCPFCYKQKFSIAHDYSIDNASNCFLFLKCDACNQVLDTEKIIMLFDAIYVYNEKVHRYIDEYCQHYGDKNLKNKIDDELENTEMIGLDNYSFYMISEN